MAGKNPLDAVEISPHVQKRDSWVSRLERLYPCSFEHLEDFCAKEMHRIGLDLTVEDIRRHCNENLIRERLGRDVSETAFRRWFTQFRREEEIRNAPIQEK